MSPFRTIVLKRLNPSPETLSWSVLPPEKNMCRNTESSSHEFQSGLSSAVSDSSLDDEPAYQERGNDLLEDWPHSKSPSLCRNTCKKVTISEHSQLRLFKVHKAASQWYSSKDREAFQAEALCEAFRIRELMAAASEGGNTRGKATLYLIQRNLLSPEEMLGIEDLISSVASARRSCNERRLHVALVLKKQEELKKISESDISNKLAELASARSSKHVDRARLRAALAAPNKFDRICP
ncbi:hypothetical protein ACHAW6_003022 [Cyclotella cf. meneghiniana]